MSLIVLADVDGTLVDGQGHLWPAAMTVVRAVERAGGSLALCSARPPWSLRLLAHELGSTVVALAACQGATIDVLREPIEGGNPKWERVRLIPVPKASAEFVHQIVGSDAAVCLYTDSSWYVTRITRGTADEATIIGRSWSGVRQHASSLEILKVLVLGDVSAVQDGQLAARRDILRFSSKPGYLEIVSEKVGIDKGASYLLASVLGAREAQSRVVAIGDGLNDLGLFASAHESFTFADASTTVRDAATVVLPADRDVALSLVAAHLETM